MMFDGYGFGLVGLLYLVVWLALLVGLGVLVVLGIRWLLRHEGTQGPARGGSADDPALTVLRERFARGEIDANEFEERRRLLG